MSYSQDELEKYLIESNDPEIRKKVFLDLHQRAKTLDLSHIESKYYCKILKYTYENFGKPEDFDVCKEHIFNDLYRIYNNDLHGFSQLKNKSGKILSSEQKIEDLNKLDEFFQEWESTINNQPQDEIIIQIAKETRNEIKSLKSDPLFNLTGTFQKSHKFKHQYKALLLRSRFLKNFALEHIEKHGTIIKISFDEKCIEFNEFSLTHIIFRHYAKIIKQTDLDKSFHTDEIDYRNLGNELKNILESIDKSGYSITGERQIKFKYKSKYYSIWISPEKEKSMRGVSGMQKYHRVETFYTIVKSGEIQKLKQLETYIVSSDLTLIQ